MAVRPGFVPLPFVEAPEPEASPIQDLPGVVESPGQAGYLLYYDELTGLYNRRLYARRFPEEAQRAREEKLPLSLIWLNVNGFKRINQEYGHVQGDHVLARVGAAIREVVGGAGIPVRYSGDEFVVLACGLALREAAELGNRILEAVRSRPVQLLNSQLTVQVSLTAGMACYPEVVADPDELLERANRAALRAKRERRDRLVATGSSEVVLDPAGLARRLPCPTLIGRHELLESLEKLLTPGAEEEKRPAVLLKGPSGIGKTRLLVALGERMRAQGCRFLMGSARQEAASQPFAALLEALEACIDREPRLLAALAEVLEAHETSALARFLPCLRPLAREGGDAAVPLRAPLARMLVRLSEMGPLVVCVDESQWIDRSTVEVLRALWQGQARLALCLALGTDDAEAGLEAGGHPLRPLVEEVRGEVVAVPPLGPAQVREMVEAILPFPVARGHLTTQVYQRSRGLPLLVEESLRYLVQTERLRLEDGKIVCDDEGSALPEDLLEARASHLADEVRRLLVHASAMGSDFSLTTLVDVEGRDEGYLRGLIDKAVQAGLLEAAEDGERFHFASSNLRRSLYREMDEQERRRLHRTISQARLREASGHTEMLLSELAHHSRLAGDAEQLSQIESQMQALQERYLPPGEL
ncbi:MAG TPA: diguanylate cyclase, partial [Candidatus Nitrosotenuis sp.]|nr:diguanylate cyclase [Candidatus Nitrosotenuis sp.]